MTSSVNHSERQGRFPWRIVGWGGAAARLLLPLIANAPWTPSDYVFTGVVFAIIGGL